MCAILSSRQEGKWVICNAKGDEQKVMMDASKTLDVSEAGVRD
jgi:hypothetical protein